MAKKSKIKPDDEPKEKKDQPVTIYVTKTEHGLLLAAMDRDGHDQLGPWMLTLIRVELKRRAAERDSIKLIERTVLDIQQRMKTATELEFNQ